MSFSIYAFWTLMHAVSIKVLVLILCAGWVNSRMFSHGNWGRWWDNTLTNIPPKLTQKLQLYIYWRSYLWTTVETLLQLIAVALIKQAFYASPLIIVKSNSLLNFWGWKGNFSSRCWILLMWNRPMSISFVL